MAKFDLGYDPREEERQLSDPVDHPSYYKHGDVEVIDIIEGLGLGFHLGNAVKYVARAGRKDPDRTAEDLRKAIWYVERYIELLQKEGK